MHIFNYVGLLLLILSATHLKKTEAFHDRPLFLNLLTKSVDNQNMVVDVSKQDNNTLPMSITPLWNRNNGEMSLVTQQIRNSSDKMSNEFRCLALNIYFEARGESEVGQHAVGHVVMNRVSNPRFPDSVCDVVHQGGEHPFFRCQFSWWCDGRSDKPNKKTAWDISVKIAREIYSGESTDPTNGALWYHADYVSPYWKDSFVQGPKIGQHIFYQDTRKINS